jgi:hypothetical protein
MSESLHPLQQTSPLQADFMRLAGGSDNQRFGALVKIRILQPGGLLRKHPENPPWHQNPEPT